jgi:hypothetical protein
METKHAHHVMIQGTKGVIGCSHEAVQRPIRDEAVQETHVWFPDSHHLPAPPVHFPSAIQDEAVRRARASLASRDEMVLGGKIWGKRGRWRGAGIKARAGGGR